MTSPVGRTYATALALVLFFLTWAVVAAQPWTPSATASDPRLKVLALRETRLRHEAKRVDRVVARRWAAYHRELAARRVQIAAAKAQNARAAAATPTAAVRVVTLPPITITRTS
jgi:hypothetical protein